MRFSMPEWNEYDVGAFLFYLGIFLVNISEKSLVALSWYGICAVCVLLGIISHWRNISLVDIVFICLNTSMAIICYFLVGNLSIKRYILVILFPFITWLLLNNSIHTYTLEAAVYLNGVYILYVFLSKGINTQVFVSSSTNFVSVFLFYPLLPYYVKTESNGKKIRIFPALFVWVLCILGRGRGGMITSTFFLAALCVIKNEYSLKSKGVKTLKLLVFILLALCSVFLIYLNISSLLTLESFEYFKSRGLHSSSRLMIWDEYLQALKGNVQNILFGVSINNLPSQVKEYHGNFHNSFINIHATSGIFMFFYVLLLLGISTVKGIRNKKWVYVVALATLCVRGFTDHVFWGAYGTPVFLYFALIQFEKESRIIKAVR